MKWDIPALLGDRAKTSIPLRDRVQPALLHYAKDLQQLWIPIWPVNENFGIS